MSRFRTGLAAGLTAGPLLLLPGCASAPPESEKTVLLGSAADTVVVLPLNVTAAMPEELGDASPPVWEALESYLREHGVELKTLAFPTARRLWLASVREARAGADGRARGFEDAARIFAGKLSRHADFDSLIVPSLFVQRAQISDRTASWDGVERRIEVEAGREGLPEDVDLVGAAAAASLHAAVLDAEGNVLQEGQGGLELLVRVRVRRSGDAAGAEPFEFAPRPEPLARPEHLREGIAEALAPFLPDLVPEDESRMRE